MTRCQSSSVMSMVATFLLIPAAYTTMSIRPNAFWMASAALPSDDRSSTSVSSRSVLRPMVSISAATSSTRGARRAVATTSAPASASPSASTRPIPLVPPTTTATRPSRLKRLFDMTSGQGSMSHMLRDTLYRLPRQPGPQCLQSRGDGGARELTTWRVRLPPGTKAQSHAPGEESVLVVQSGAATVTVAGQEFEVSRKDVFQERATAVYAPPGEPITIVGKTEFEGIVVSTPASRRGSPARVSPQDIRVNARGRGNYAREVHDIFVTDQWAERLMVGE